ncbi:hypothetical protein OsJ_24363 [Oryza sativa Japonica Group]|uniref:Uncharacterized protein n=1 Tax=Oryza sativa subsp. japonica TaxID=39947 RepID=B9FXE3_ORYSJ|nr:hypothetical protein OsJ_24363 [Oryza sativa Japonica Group]
MAREGFWLRVNGEGGHSAEEKQCRKKCDVSNEVQCAMCYE